MPAGMNVDESFTPHARLKRDSTRSPIVAKSAIAAPHAAATGYVSTFQNGTVSPQPNLCASARNTHAVAAEKSMEPARPSHDFFGEIVGHILCYPNAMPNANPPVSENFAVAMSASSV